MNLVGMAKLCLGLVVLSSAAISQTSPSDDAVARITNSLLAESKAYEFDEQLADHIGPRITGSRSYEQAVQWALNQFRSVGLENVHTESFPMKSLWESESAATGRMIEPRDQALHLISLGWAPSTPPDGIRGRVFLVRNLLSPSLLAADREQIRGSIALVDRSSYSFPDGFLPGQYFAALNSLRQLGAKAVFVAGGRSNNDVDYAGAASMDGSVAELPIARLGREDLALIVRLLEQGPVTVDFNYTNRLRGPASADNVVAEIRGRENPDEYVLIGAHLDSVQTGTGAQDDGTGVASVLDAARALKASGAIPRRSVRFVLFGGEEEWELGSHVYAAQHSSELDKCVAVLVTDTGSDTAFGWYVNGRDDEISALKDFSSQLVKIGGDGVSSSTDYLLHSDHTAFLLRGVPTLMLWTEMSKYFLYVHQPGDTFDKVEKEKLAKGAAIVAVTAFLIAEQSKRFAPRISSPEIQDLLIKTKQYNGYLDMKQHSNLEITSP